MDLSNQQLEPGRLLVFERWVSADAFRGHLQQAHVQEFRKAIQGIVDSVTLQISEPVL